MSVPWTLALLPLGHPVPAWPTSPYTCEEASGWAVMAHTVSYFHSSGLLRKDTPMANGYETH